MDIDGNIYCTSNVSTSNLNVYGNSTILNTTVLITEQLELNNSNNATSMTIKQLNENELKQMLIKLTEIQDDLKEFGVI